MVRTVRGSSTVEKTIEAPFGWGPKIHFESGDHSTGPQMPSTASRRKHVWLSTVGKGRTGFCPPVRISLTSATRVPPDPGSATAPTGASHHAIRRASGDHDEKNPGPT